MPALEALLLEKIQQSGGSISFTEYMNTVLYQPQFGYYSAHPTIFGSTEQTGDFTTAPEISSLYGQTLANVFYRILKEIPDAIILELGAGTGKLAVDVLKALESMGVTPKAYWIVDPSETLRQKQQKTLQEALPHWFERLRWFEKLPETTFAGIIVANEVLDAMPAQRFKITSEGVFETYVTCTQDTQTSQDLHSSLTGPSGILSHKGRCIHFEEIDKPTDDPEIQKIRQMLLSQIPEETLRKQPYQSERLPALRSFFEQLYAVLEKGVILLADYGFPQHEFYHPDRFMGTLMCHYQQKAHTNPYIHLGKQDITTHVDFSDVAEKAMDAGFSLAGYTQQAAFLMNAGLLDFIQSGHLTLHQKTAIHLLTSPSEMGELFKIMALTKQFEQTPFSGFESFDKRHTL